MHLLQGEEILSQASTVANTTAAEEEDEEEDAGGGEESEEEESDVVRGKGGGLVSIHINYNCIYSKYLKKGIEEGRTADLRYLEH